MTPASRFAASLASPWQPAQSPLKIFIPSIKFSSVGAIGFTTCGARRAAALSSAKCPNAASTAVGVPLAPTSSHPIQAAANVPIGIASIPTTNPSANFFITRSTLNHVKDHFEARRRPAALFDANPKKALAARKHAKHAVAV